MSRRTWITVTLAAVLAAVLGASLSFTGFSLAGTGPRTSALAWFASFESSLVTGALRAPDPHAAPPLPVFEAAELTPVWRSATELRGQSGSSFPDFSLTDQNGRLLARGDLQGRVVVAHFFFTHCSNICPTLISAMGRVRDAYAGHAGVMLLSHSVTPDYDTPVMLKAYAQANKIDGQQWRLLTGSNEEISRVAHGGYFVPRSAVSAQGVIHTELFVLLDEQQRVRGVYNGTLRPEMEQLIGDVKTLLAAHSAR